MGTTKFDYTALLEDGTIINADNEEDLIQKVAGRSVVVSYHRKEDNLRYDRDEIIIDSHGKISEELKSKLPVDVRKKLRD